MVYQKPKLLEKSVKRDKKNIYLNNKKPMTTKRIEKTFNYMERDIAPKRTDNKIINKSEIISSMNERQINSMRDKITFRRYE